MVNSRQIRGTRCQHNEVLCVKIIDVMLPLPSKKYTKRIRGTHVGYTICLAIGVFVLFFVAFKSTDSSTPATYQFTTTVDTQNKTIDLLQSNPPITTMSKLFTSDSLWPHRISRIFSYIDDLLASIQNIASPTARTVHIRAGMRREQVANAFATGLNWNAIEKKNFLRLSIANAPISEGFYYPDTYVLTIGTNAETVHKVLLDTFAKEISSHYATSTAEKVDMATALKIASILQREAAGHSDMRLISGIIWNRIFRNMSLDMDSTLQYARGTHANGWWPKVRPKDKSWNVSVIVSLFAKTCVYMTNQYVSSLKARPVVF